MKTIDLSKGQHSLTEILDAAKRDDVLLHAASGEDFVIERADVFDREIARLGRSRKFMSFLEARSRDNEDLSLKAVREKRGL